MDRMMVLAGRALGVLGIAACAVAVIGRLAGQYWLRGFELGSLLQVGVAAMVAGCFILLWVMTRDRA